MSDEPITVVAQFEIRDGAEADFEAAIDEFVPHCLADPGLIRFRVHRDADDPRRFLFYEDWEDRAAFDASMSAPWRGPYLAATRHLWERPRVVRVYERLAGPWDDHGPECPYRGAAGSGNR